MTLPALAFYNGATSLVLQPVPPPFRLRRVFVCPPSPLAKVAMNLNIFFRNRVTPLLPSFFCRGHLSRPCTAKLPWTPSRPTVSCHRPSTSPFPDIGPRFSPFGRATRYGILSPPLNFPWFPLGDKSQANPSSSALEMCHWVLLL